MDVALHQHYAALEPRHWWFQGRRRVMASVLEQLLVPRQEPPPRILDIGCGTGEMLDMLRSFGTASGMDAAPEAVAHCLARFGSDVKVMLGAVPADLPSPGQVDVVTAFDVIEHLDDDGATLHAIHQVLPLGGALVVTVPAFAFLWGPHDVVNHHRRRYTRSALRLRLTSAGFDVERISYFNTWLFPVVAAVRLKNRLRRHRDTVTSSDAHPATDFTMPPPWLNWMLLQLFASERVVLRRGLSLPFGVSIFAVARRRHD